MKYKTKNGWDVISAEERERVETFCAGYKSYMDFGKTERKATVAAIEIAKGCGFKPIEEFATLKAGDKVYFNNRGKGAVFAIIGSQPMQQGVNIIGSHIDSPRLDLKPVPLFEDSDIAYFKTQYYGGIKKYQWTCIPLAIHGTIVKGNGEIVEMTVGEEDTDPVFCVTDLLPHLAKDQMQKKVDEAISGESLNIILATQLAKEKEADEKGTAFQFMLNLFKEKYDIEEEDFLSAEIELVPAGKSRDYAFDRSLVGAYGHDDRVCAYTSLMALMELEKPERTSVVMLVDKEEIGSVGVTGMKSTYYINSIVKMYKLVNGFVDICERNEMLSNSICISADVTAALDPLYKEVAELRNAPRLGHGICVSKYGGSRGKGGSSDASAELVGLIRRIFNDNSVTWQIGELGKVDQGGGGTIAGYVTDHDVPTIDIGVPLLCMHAPLELASKVDIYNAYKGYKAFLAHS